MNTSCYAVNIRSTIDKNDHAYIGEDALNLLIDGFSCPATKNIDKSVYVLENFLVHRARSRRPEGQATSVCIALRRRKFPTSHRYTYIGTIAVKLPDIL